MIIKNRAKKLLILTFYIALYAIFYSLIISYKAYKLKDFPIKNNLSYRELPDTVKFLYINLMYHCINQSTKDSVNLLFCKNLLPSIYKINDTLKSFNFDQILSLDKNITCEYDAIYFGPFISYFILKLNNIKIKIPYSKRGEFHPPFIIYKKKLYYLYLPSYDNVNNCYDLIQKKFGNIDLSRRL
ncbi:MAG: hypothetical protein OHK0036_20130 [Bacteroidia bacterium]